MKRQRLLLLLGAFVVLSLIQAFNSCSSTAPRTARREKNPVQPLLSLPPEQQQDGTAVAILVDTSGSMREEVAGASGAMEPKIAIARRAVVDTIRRIRDFAQKNPGRPILVAVYEFSTRGRSSSCRKVIELGVPDADSAASAVQSMKPEGDTPIGDAMIEAKKDLDGTGLSRRHILVVSDGMNNRGYSPGAVALAMSEQPETSRTGVYFIAFDVEESVFNPVKEAGGLVLTASSETDLNQTIDFILTGKILVEQPGK
jgi:Ca-activated chloride channel homolog